MKFIDWLMAGWLVCVIAFGVYLHIDTVRMKERRR